MVLRVSLFLSCGDQQTRKAPTAALLNAVPLFSQFQFYSLVLTDTVCTCVYAPLGRVSFFMFIFSKTMYCSIPHNGYYRRLMESTSATQVRLAAELLGNTHVTRGRCDASVSDTTINVIPIFIARSIERWLIKPSLSLPQLTC